MLAIMLIVIGIFSRLIIHVPNFTPVIALSLFSGTYLNKKTAIIVPVGLMALSDFIIGWHDTMLYTYGSIIVITLIGFWIKKHKNVVSIALTGISSSIFFFIVTNFGTWATGELYPLTRDGLKQCFIMAIPFFSATLLSTLVYCLVFFGSYEWIAYRVRETKLARVLLTI